MAPIALLRAGRWSGLSLVIIVVLLSGFGLLALYLVGLAIRALQGPVQRSRSGRYAVGEPDQHQPGAGSKSLVEPLAGEQPYDDAERELEPDRSVSAEAFPVLLHRYRRAALS
jgi:hypothetical protein